MDRSQLLARVQAAHRAGNGQELSQAVADLEAHDRGIRSAASQQRELDWSGQFVAQRFASGPMNGDRHTFATDWIGDLDGPGLDYRVAMRAEAAGWVRSLAPAVRADREEFTAQAMGRARTVASAYGASMAEAYTEFLRGVTAASGLPQLDQVVDPHDNPSPTPYPTEVFDNFAPEQNDYNGGIEGMNHDSEQASTNAPMFQQLQQMDGSGSGFGSGPERPATHTTQFDTSNSYAEVPLGPPGTIPSAGPGQGTPMNSSAPTPMMGDSNIQDSDPQPAEFGSAAKGMTNNSDEERGEHKTGSAHYTVPDPHGFRWLASHGEVYHPYHEACASSHWPDETCSVGLVHTASVAIDHSMTLDQARHMASCEAIGAREGMRALQASRGVLSVIAAHHNRVAKAWGATERTMADTAVLHGFQAVVRPVLADAAQGCTKCRLGASVIVNGERLCGEHGRQAREAEGKARQPYDGSSRTGSRLDFPLAAEAAFAKGAPFAGYKDFASCVAANQDKRDPEAYCGKIKHQVEGSSTLTQIQQTTSPDGTTPTPEADVLPDAVMFPIIPERGGDSDEGRPGPPTYPGMQGSDENQQKEAARNRSMTPSPGTAAMFGHMDAMEGKDPQHKDHFAFSKVQHGKYLRGYNMMRGLTHAVSGKAPWSKKEYGDLTGRPDMHSHYMGAYATAWAQQHPAEDNPYWADADDASRSMVMKPKQAAHGATCPECGSTNTTGYAHGQHDCQDCGHSWGGYGGPKSASLQDFGWVQTTTSSSNWTNASNLSLSVQPGAWIQLQGEYRPIETLPTGETVGDPDFEGGFSDDSSQSERGEHKTGSQHTAARCATCGRKTDDGECMGCSNPPGQCTCSPKAKRMAEMRRQADFMSKPHQTTDQLTPIPNSANTSPQPWSQNADPQSQDYQAGFSEGQQDAGAGNRPTFMDNSDRVSSYVKGYAEGYSSASPHGQSDIGGHPGADPQRPDVPKSMGGDSGQDVNSQEALQAAQRAQASRKTASIKVSAGFVSRAAGNHPDFRKAYAFASKWQPGARLVATGSAYFEAGLYAGISDRPAAVQQSWIMAHRKLAARDRRLADRMGRHKAFTETLVPSGYRVRKNGVYAYVPQRRTAGTTTDLITDGPGTSPDPMGSTPLNGPGTPPSMGGGDDPARPGGPSPYQGAPPQGGGPVVQDDVMGPSTTPPKPIGPLGQGFSGPGPGYTNMDQVPPSARGGRAGADLTPGAPNTAAETGYSNPGAYQGAPQGGDRVAAFRQTVQASLAARRQAVGPKA